ncbi:MAG TPA: DUF1801 domain-containing protein [Ilumatobacteraceae bacterium]|nr:DUF1801 domain-containing protein [Ilumatobacteraceae bacterium]
MATIATRPTGEDVTAFIDAVPDDRRRADAHELRALIQRVTGDPGRMWGPSIIGFGATTYTNTSGTHDWFVVGFSPRKQALTLYGIHDGYSEPDPLLEQLGPHTTGRGCVYLKRLEHADTAVLEQLVRNAWQTADHI